ncbi:hypothetical protein [Hydrocarboniphaga effusa]|uniref:hypothetical protein n=1 Tax=Hydrocarboniphaga effusa TaxID=243629 RepID=UPI003BABF69B
MKLSLHSFTDPAAFAEQFAKLPETAPLDTPLSNRIIAQLRGGPASWHKLLSDLDCTRRDLDSTLSAMLAAHQIEHQHHVGGFRYALPGGA